MTENAKSRASAQTSEIWKEISEVTVDNIESEVESRSGSSEESDKRLVTLYKSDITLEQLSEVTQALERYTIEMPTLEDSRRLIQAVSSRYSNAHPRNTSRSSARREGLGKQIFRIMRVVRSQTRLFSLPFWLITAFITLLGGWSGMLFKEDATQPLVIIVPAVAALSVFGAFRSYGTPMFRLEMSMPISPAQLVYGRLLLIVGYDVLLALAASLLMGASMKELGLHIINWLMPLGISSMAALAAMLYMKLSGAIVTSLLVWSLQLILNDRLGMFYWFGSYQEADWTMSKLVGGLFIIVLAGFVHWKIARMQQPGGI